ncbi:MAG: hypothetical protein AB9882_05105 [Ignavibacteriaceae bacterium]
MEQNIEVIVSNVIDGIVRGKTVKEIEKELKTKPGYKESVVPTIYSWIFDKLLTDLALEKKEFLRGDSTRILSEEEMWLVGKDNYAKLIKLHNLGLIIWEDINILLEKLSVWTDEPLDNQEFNIFLLSSLFEAGKQSRSGSRWLLYIYDKIN